MKLKIPARVLTLAEEVNATAKDKGHELRSWAWDKDRTGIVGRTTCQLCETEASVSENPWFGLPAKMGFVLTETCAELLAERKRLQK